MRTLPLLFFFLIIFTPRTHAQQLRVHATRFIGGDSVCYAPVYGAMETANHGILFTGSTDCSNCGDIPPNIIDTASGFPPNNLIVGLLDSNKQLSWLKVYGGSRTDIGYRICLLADSNYAILASTESSDRDVTDSIGIRNIWVLKIDRQGNLLWQHCYGGLADNEALSFAATPDNGLIILGAATVPGGDMPFHYGNSPLSFDWLVIKTDSLGNKQWVKTVGGTGDEGVTGSIMVANNGYYLASYSSSTDHECSDVSWHPGVNTNYDFHLLKLDTAGTVEWDSSYGSRADDIVYNAILDPRDSSILIAGQVQDSGYMVQQYFGNNDGWVIKTDKNGKLLWTKTLGDPISTEYARSIALSNALNGYVVFSRADFQSNDTLAGIIGNLDGVLYQLDSIGNCVTQKVIGGVGNEWEYGIINYNSGYIAVGMTSSASFTEGQNIDRLGEGEDGYITYIDYWPETVKKVTLTENRLMIYPNPSTNNVWVIIPETDRKGTLTITNELGQLFYNGSINAQTNSISIQTELWPKGEYMIRYESVTSARSAQFVKY